MKYTMIQRAGKNVKYDVMVAVDNTLKSLNAGEDYTRWEAGYNFIGGVIILTDNNDTCTCNLYIYKLDNGAVVALADFYETEDGYEMVGSDGNIYVWNNGKIVSE